MHGKNVRSWLLGTLLGTLALGGTGCGAGDCGTFADAYCAKLAECEPVLSGASATSTMTSCVALERATCERSVAAPGSNIDAAQAGRCGEVYRKATCYDLYSQAV